MKNLFFLTTVALIVSSCGTQKKMEATRKALAGSKRSSKNGKC